MKGEPHLIQVIVPDRAMMITFLLEGSPRFPAGPEVKLQSDQTL